MKINCIFIWEFLKFILQKKNKSFIILTQFFPTAQQPPSGPGPPHYRGFTITLRQATVGRTPLDGWSARSRDLYLTTHIRQMSIPPAKFEPAFPASERPQTHSLDRAAAGIGRSHYSPYKCRYFPIIQYMTLTAPQTQILLKLRIKEGNISNSV
jgi:hypothetical protein